VPTAPREALRNEKERMVAINLSDFGSACGLDPRGAEPPKL
jgi:hypothetical protein